MMFLIIVISVLYLLIGFISLFTALLFFELGRPKDLIQSGLLIFLGTFLILNKNIFNFQISLILTLNAVLINFFFLENFSYRWNQLLEKEKSDIKSLSGLKKNWSIIYKIIYIDLKNLFLNIKVSSIFKNTPNKKKWVRKEDDKNSNNKKETLKEYMKNSQTADFSKKDIINDEKNNKKNNQID
tara:strand:- start:1172 stop:1723 length:552 start_codon:yes stop_codon:yes gene_type:complete